MYKKIIITGDLLRLTLDLAHSNQNANITWLYRLLKHQLSTATSLEVELLHTNTATPFDPAHFYTLNHLEPSQQNWIKIYNATPTQEALNYLQEYFQDTLVVGFELPTIFLKAFELLEIPYIDTIIHPIRYLDDLLLAFRTSDPQIYTQLKSFQYNEEYYTIHANIHAAAMAKMKKPRLKPNSAIFAGQVEVDKSLINGNTLVTLQEYKEKLQDLAKTYNHIYIKPHPYAAQPQKLKQIFKEFDNVSYTDQNIYYLLAQEEITALYSISSSTVLEAKYWGKKGEYLYKNPFYIDHQNTQPNTTEYISIQDHFLTSFFWAQILQGLIPTKQLQHLPIPSKTSRLRNTLQNYWGYNFLDSDILLKSYDLAIINQEESVSQILQELQPQVAKKRKSLEQKIQNNKTIRSYLQTLKKVPVLGRFLYFVKHKILRWH